MHAVFFTQDMKILHADRGAGLVPSFNFNFRGGLLLFCARFYRAFELVTFKVTMVQKGCIAIKM
jgi:hypothetical protein